MRLPMVIMGASVTLLAGTGARAQLDDRTVVSVLRECRRIADSAARIACYDNIPLGGGAASTPPAPRGFGANQLPRAPSVAAAQPDAVTERVAEATEREPGVWLLTLEDGAQWLFVDGVSPSYVPPRRGASVEIIGASMGSYLLRYAGQRGIRIRRIR